MPHMMDSQRGNRSLFLPTLYTAPHGAASSFALSFIYDRAVSTSQKPDVTPCRSPPLPTSAFPSSISDVADRRASFYIPAPSEPGKIAMYSPQFYAACTFGGILSCGLTHMAVTPLDLVKCNMQKAYFREWSTSIFQDHVLPVGHLDKKQRPVFLGLLPANGDIKGRNRSPKRFGEWMNLRGLPPDELEAALQRRFAQCVEPETSSQRQEDFQGQMRDEASSEIPSCGSLAWIQDTGELKATTGPEASEVQIGKTFETVAGKR